MPSIAPEPPRCNIVPLPVERYSETWAGDAYVAHTAMIRQQCANPALAKNPAWKALVEAAYRQFERAFEAPL